MEIPSEKDNYDHRENNYNQGTPKYSNKISETTKTE